MPEPLLLLLDMDGPLAAFDDHFFAEMARHGIPLTVPSPAEQTARYATDHLADPRLHGRVRQLIAEPGWFEALPVVQGARDGVRALLAAGVEVHVCTKPLEDNPTCRDAKGAWLREHLPELERSLVIAPDKSLVHGDVLLDDAPKPVWYRRATWVPVIFPANFNGPGSEWGHLPRWDWSRPTEDLLGLLEHARATRAERGTTWV